MKKVCLAAPVRPLSRSNAWMSACRDEGPAEITPRTLPLCPREYIDARWEQALESMCAFDSRNSPEYL